MKIGIVGLAGCGKTTIFNALTGSSVETSSYPGGKKDPNLAVVKVPDQRLDTLVAMYNPRRVVPAQIQYVDLGGTISKEEGQKALDEMLTLLRPVDALIHVVRGFEFGGIAPDPQGDYETFEGELIFTDLLVVEKRLERLEADLKKGKKGDPKEMELLKRAKEILERDEPLRADPELARAPELRGYAFLSAKPCMVVLNLPDDAADCPQLRLAPGTIQIPIKGNLEMELAQLSGEEAEAFRQEMGADEPATYQVIRESYGFLGLISFFTVGEDEVRAWTIRRGTNAQRAAGAIHSDLEKGFIRAEVVAYEDLTEAGSYAAAQKAGKVRLEGKDYIVQDGDILNIRFNV